MSYFAGTRYSAPTDQLENTDKIRFSVTKCKTMTTRPSYLLSCFRIDNDPALAVVTNVSVTMPAEPASFFRVWDPCDATHSDDHRHGGAFGYFWINQARWNVQDL